MTLTDAGVDRATLDRARGCLALCLAESLLARQGFDPVDQLQRYVRWWEDGYMSCAAVPILFASTPRKATGFAAASCGTTHRAGAGAVGRRAPRPARCARPTGLAWQATAPADSGAGYGDGLTA